MLVLGAYCRLSRVLLNWQTWVWALKLIGVVWVCKIGCMAGNKVENTLLELSIEECGSPVKLDRRKNKQEEDWKWEEGTLQGERWGKETVAG
jgi:hypothetical protein